jgi:glycine/D-amino acid oxidase-like deaminating enzyme
MQTNSGLRHYRTRAEKAKIVGAYRRSGLSQSDFAEQQRIAPSNIQRWVQQFSTSGKAASPAALVEVPNVLGGRPSCGPYRLHFSKGLLLEVAPGFEVGEVRALAQLLHSL